MHYRKVTLLFTVPLSQAQQSEEEMSTMKYKHAKEIEEVIFTIRSQPCRAVQWLYSHIPRPHETPRGLGMRSLMWPGNEARLLLVLWCHSRLM